MVWIIAIIAWHNGIGHLLIQTDDDKLYKATVTHINPDTIGDKISEQFGIARERVIYHDTKQTLYRRLTYMRFVMLI